MMPGYNLLPILPDYQIPLIRPRRHYEPAVLQRQTSQRRDLRADTPSIYEIMCRQIIGAHDAAVATYHYSLLYLV